MTEFKHPERMMRDLYLGIDSRMVFMLYDLNAKFYERYGLQIVVTCLMRTQEENAAVGGKKYSAHLRGEAADIRIRNFTQEQIDFILGHLRDSWHPAFLYCTRHTGTADHIHLNIKWAYARKGV